MARHQFEFEGFRVDAAQRNLYALRGGPALELPPRAFDALLHFLERPGELLSKRELMKALWPSVVVEENSLNQVVSTLRRVLGEKPSEHRYIVTAPGRGYRFVANVRRIDAMVDPGAARSLAVLPFVNQIASHDAAHLGDAVAIDLVRSLANSRIRIAPHTASFAFRDTPVDTVGVARTLNVRLLLEGQVSRHDGVLNVAVRLMDVHTGTQVLARTFARDERDIATLQNELARAILQAIDPEMPPGTVAAGVVAPAAYANYLKALAHTMRPSFESTITAIDLLREAVAVDAQFARARSLLAIQYTTCVMFGFAVPAALELARAEASTALSMDDSNGETHCAAAVIECLGGDWCRAEERFRTAHGLSVDPLISGLRCAYMSLSVGHLHRALQQADYASRVAPTHPIGPQMLAILHQVIGNEDEARRYADVAITLGQSPTLSPLSDLLVLIDQRAHRPAEASARKLQTLPQRLQMPGHFDSATSLAQLEAALTLDELDPPMRKRLILWYVMAGDLDHAYDLAHRSLDFHAREGTVGGAWGVLWLPEMQAFRADPRFDPLARRLRLFDYWNEYGPPDGYALNAGTLVSSG
ncbi:MAG: winged helix-turn-helix domain-containing protein [Pseudomonadota bacterium]